jgi:transcriptional regulator with XRE-family HTH domain
LEISNKSPDPMDVALGATIRVRRRTIGMSQEALAEKCGVSFQQVQKYENGVNRVSFSRLVQIARALDCRVTDLMGVLDVPNDASAEMDILSRIRTPGALELLTEFERLSPDARASLLVFLRATIDGAPARTEAPEHETA